LASCKKEGIIPPVEQVNFFQQPGSMDFSLDAFLQAQGIESGPNNTDNSSPSHEDDPAAQQQQSAERAEFLFRLEQLKERYKEELEKLNQVCNEFCTRLNNLLRYQSELRPISEQERQMKINGFQHKFDYVRNQLRQNVCNAVITLQKQFNQTKKKKRSLPKKASDMLSNWFYDHLSDPYPSEEEKTMMAATCGLTMTQINNWFGNKRIRYKRKCLEQESKRTHGADDGKTDPLRDDSEDEDEPSNNES